ncbi:GTPase IMAP family member 4-like isoform X2 [Pecten maximus]|nr:GTPase IMAP family member 4-like isoform X2 [Pecten maximus]
MSKMNNGAEVRKFGSTSLPPNSLVGGDFRRLTAEVRIILIGKTGSGKSSTGNTILGRSAFSVVPGGSSGTKRCSFFRSPVHKRNVMIVDTPGLFDSHISLEETHKELVKCIGLAAPGPHVFLLTIPANIRSSPEELNTLDLLKNVFGESMVDYTMVVFTKADEMKRQLLTEETFFKTLPDQVHRLVKLCKGGHLFLDNQSPREKEKQVEALISRIEYIMDQRLHKCYSNDQFKVANDIMEAHTSKMKSESLNKRLATVDEEIQEGDRGDTGQEPQQVQVVEDPQQEDGIDDQARREVADGKGPIAKLMEKLRCFWESIKNFFTKK